MGTSCARGPTYVVGTNRLCLCQARPREICRDMCALKGMYLPCKDTWTMFVSCGDSLCPPDPTPHTHKLWTQTLLRAPSLEHFYSPKSQEVCEPVSSAELGSLLVLGGCSIPNQGIQSCGLHPKAGTLLSLVLSWTPSLWQFDGTHIVSGSLDTSIRVWDVESGNCLHTLMGHQSLTSGMELRDNILVSGNADSTVKIWDIKTGQCLQTLQGERGHDDHVITCLQFCGNRIVSGSDDNTLKVWSAVTGEVSVTVTRAVSVALSQCQGGLGQAPSPCFGPFVTRTRGCAAPLPCFRGGELREAHLSLVSCSPQCVQTLVGHTGGVWSSQMRDSIVISGSTDRTLKVWNADSGECVHTLYGHTSTVRCMHLHEKR
uniref:F-box and WD repeat domain containing 7, E3 ubiquitin protein ligase n=1 Tax=Zonotrichia albicollis TaxID=44394 RepID=A0A8D2MB61_ZONAL